jgi:hypothetical protein
MNLHKMDISIHDRLLPTYLPQPPTQFNNIAEIKFKGEDVDLLYNTTNIDPKKFHSC